MPKMLKNLSKLSIIIFTVLHLSCQTVPANNWSVDDKANVLATVAITLQLSHVSAEYQKEIAVKVLNKCISKYPNVDDFKNDTGYSGEAFKEVMMEK